MVALFSTLQSSANADTAVSSSSSCIPTLIQLYKTKAIHLDPNATLPGYAVLSYQAIEVSPPSTEGDGTLFGQKLNKTLVVVSPNLGVWNCLVPKEPALVDKLLCVPEPISQYCFTVDLAHPSQVEPTISSLQEALVRLMIERPPPPSDKPACTTSLMQLRKTTFGLAPNDPEASSKLNSGVIGVAPDHDDNDDKNNIALMIVAIVSPSNTTTSADAYKETQSQALVLYHLRKYAAALNATLCFVRDSPQTLDGDENQPTMTMEQLAIVWKEWAQLNDLDDSPSLYPPGRHQDDLIESILLRNAHCPGHWEASKDSIWKALPPVLDNQKTELTKKESHGDDSWLSTLRESVVTDAAPITSSAPKTINATPNAKEDAAAASSFFENLLNS